MSLGAAIAPVPTSPQASTLDTGGTTATRVGAKARMRASCGAVSGCSHMAVFMAGATTHGFASHCHARRTQVTRLSHIPWTTFASVFAERGATTTTSAHERRSMCNTGSPTARHCHSSASRCTGTSSGMPPRSVAATKCSAAFDNATCTSHRGTPSASGCWRASTSSRALIDATLPVIRSRHRGRRAAVHSMVGDVIGCKRGLPVAVWLSDADITSCFRSDQ
mmetsp:Transcript_32436/g.100336  ORF Transcript_32436/g.100336 Transcript_32436/m.100336 type:complete len:222 (+) Transcript_32436:99-764(+)